MNRIIQVGLKRLFIFLECVLVVSLTACGGGGGGGGSSSSSAAPAPIPTATNIPFTIVPASHYTSGYTKTFHLSGSDTAGGTYTATASTAIQPQTLYNGQPAIPVQIVVTITNTKTSGFGTVTGVGYYSANITSLMNLGYSDSIGNIYTATSLNVIPQTAMIGASGVIGTYSGSGTAAGKTLTASWQLTNANNGLANYIVTESFYIGSTLDSSGQSTIVIDQQGNPQSMTMVVYLASNGVTMTLSGN